MVLRSPSFPLALSPVSRLSVGFSGQQTLDIRFSSPSPPPLTLEDFMPQQSPQIPVLGAIKNWEAAQKLPYSDFRLYLQLQDVRRGVRIHGGEGIRYQ